MTQPKSNADTDFVFTESKRCLDCKKPLCKKGCPVHYDIPAFLKLARCGKFDEAKGVVGHIFGEVCGYICPRDKQCKGSCVLNKCKAPIDVGRVERDVFANCEMTLIQCDTALQGLKVAVIGGGVSGLTFAELCYKSGAHVTVLEKEELLHTLKSIPSFRLPKSAVEKIVSAVNNSGIEVKKQTVTQQDMEILKRKFDVVYIAVGVSVPNKMNIIGEEYATIADDFLRGNKFGETLVIGGGNTAMDCARLNARNGCKTTVAYRRTRQEMPAFEKEVASSEEEGVKFCFNLAPQKVTEQNGKLLVTFLKTVSEGRGKLVFTDETVEISCDILVTATGNGYDRTVFDADKYLAVDENNLVAENVYAGGDAIGKTLAVEAVADAINAYRAVKERFKR